MKSMKRAMIASAISIVLCAALLVGTTFAWFTDSIVNKGNKIQAGNLKIEATAYDLGTGGASVTISGVNGGKSFTFEPNGEDLRNSAAPIIDDSGWEPGMISAKLLEVRNEGSLKAKVKLNFTTAGELTSALWFDFVKIDDQGAQEGAFGRKEMTSLSAFADTVEIPLGPKASEEQADHVRFVFVYGMKEDAGNEYKDKTFTADVTILAAQVAAAFDFTPVSNVEQLQTAIAEGGGVVSLTADLEPSSALNIVNATIVGNGKALTGGQMGYGGRVVNLTTGNSGDASLTLNGVKMVGETSQFNSKGISAYDADTVTLNLENSSVEAKAYAIRIGTGVTNGATVHMKNGALKGWAGFEANSRTTARFENVTFTGTNYDLSGSSNGYNVVTLQEGSANSTLTFENCVFDLTKSGAADYYFFGANLGNGNITITCTGCTFIYNGAEISYAEVPDYCYRMGAAEGNTLIIR